MVGKIVNLRAARKARTRAERKTRADSNAALHGRTKAQRAEEAAARERAARTLDGHRIDERDGGTGE